MKKTSLAASGLLVSGLLVVGGIAPANADGAASSTCNDDPLMSLTSTFTAPSSMVAGAGVPVDLTSQLTAPQSLLTDVLSLLTGITGTGSTSGTITGPVGFSQAIPASSGAVTGVLSNGSVPIGLPTSSATFTPPTAGDYEVAVDQASASLSSLTGDLNLTCTPSNPVIGTIHVVASSTGLTSSTTVLTLARSTEAYGQATRATATVTSQLGQLTGAPNGSAVFTVGGMSVEQQLTDGVADITLPRLSAGKAYQVTAEFVPGASELTSGSSDAATITVVKDKTTTRVAAPNLRKRHHAIAVIKVLSAHRATVGGKVKVTLKRGKHVLTHKTVRLMKGAAHVRFGKIRKRGKNYSVVAQYLGTHNFVRSSKRDGFRVR